MSLNHQDVNGEGPATISAASVREQLAKLIESPPFSHSRRFPTFLRFVVEQALSGDSDQLKERTIGVEVFSRGADYDTASDPIVRVTAAEIRKRIAQYYAVPEHQDQLRISLPSGSYVPQFHWPQNGLGPNDEQPAAALGSSASKPAVLSRMTLFLCAVALSVGAAAGWFLHMTPEPGGGSFWAPVLNSSDPVLFCVADQNQYSEITLRDANDPTRQTELKDNLTAVVFDDLSPVVKIAGILESRGKRYSLRGENATTLSELRAGTTIVVGAFDNAWALRLTRPLRYRFDNDPPMSQFRIIDTSSKPHPPWIVNRLQQMDTNNYKDYAVVARFTDPTTGKLAVIAAGIARGGTIAAGEFLTNPEKLAQLEQAARTAGNKANMEFVLSTQIINGEPGEPTLEASYFW